MGADVRLSRRGQPDHTEPLQFLLVQLLGHSSIQLSLGPRSVQIAVAPLQYIECGERERSRPSHAAAVLHRYIRKRRSGRQGSRSGPVPRRSSSMSARRGRPPRNCAGSSPSPVLGITGTELNLFLARECGRVSAGSAACYAGRLKSLLRLLLLLARLGLRAVEVSRLELRDVDWSTSQIGVDGKGHRRDRLPLPADVGEALVAHLSRRGPCPGQPRVFLTVHAPIRPLEASGVRTIVRNACRRAGIEHVAAHRLHHALGQRAAARWRVDDRRWSGAAPPHS